MDFPKTMVKVGMILIVNNQKGYEAALNSGFKEKQDEQQEGDEGHKKLILDLKLLLEDAEEGKFHDFRTESATPKGDLIEALHILTQCAANGKYDN